MRRKLKLFKHNIISKPVTADLLSIIGNYYLGQRWFYFNHLEVECKINLKVNQSSNFDQYSIYFVIDGTYGREWEKCPCLTRKKLRRQNINKNILCNYLKRGYYIFVSIKVQEIKEYRFGRRDAMHPLLISGYDNKKNKFLCSDFFGYPAKYQSIWISCNSVLKAINNYDATLHYEFDVFEAWKYYKFFQMDFPITILLKRLNLFLEGGYRKKSGDLIYCGINIFDAIIMVLEECLEEEKIVDIPYLFVIIDFLNILNFALDSLLLNKETNRENICLFIMKWKTIIYSLIKENIKFSKSQNLYELKYDSIIIEIIEFKHSLQVFIDGLIREMN